MYEAEKREIKDEVRKKASQEKLQRIGKWIIGPGLPQAVLLLQEMWSINGLSGSCSWTRSPEFFFST